MARETADYYREKAERYRRVARSIVDRRMDTALQRLAVQFDEKAAELESLSEEKADAIQETRTLSP